jgi:hypothetical protein
VANGSSAVRPLLKDVEIQGAVVVPKKKLLWLLGWGQDRSGAWKDLLAQWEELGQKKDLLYGLEVGEQIILICNQDGNTCDRISEWADEQS